MRSCLFLVVAIISPTVASSAAAYPWPVRPFHEQHPVRANFGDPRTIFRDGLFSNGLDGAGTFLLHNGIDISAPDGTPVYPVVSGVVTHASGLTVSIRTADHRAFVYMHIIPLVTVGERVIAQVTTLGSIAATYGHVHFTELRGSRVWNPLAAGGIRPYVDLTDPVVRAIYVRRWNSLEPLDPAEVCGRIAIVADAYDTQSIPVKGAFAGFPVSPARVTWTLKRGDGTRFLAAATGRTDFSATLPSEKDFWRIYARGTYQNGPRFGRRQYRMAGLFMFQLTRQGLETRELANGIYKIVVRAYDIKGNEGTLTRTFHVANTPSTPSGCKPPAPTPSTPAAPPR